MGLHQAAAEGDERKLKSLLTGGFFGRILRRKSIELDTPDQQGNTPLALAVQNGQVAAVALLVEHGADANASLRSGSTLLHDAAMRNHPDIASLLIDHGADIEANESGSRMTPLAQAAFSGSTETAAVLLQRGASVDVRCWEGETPLHLAAKRGCVEVVRLLLGHGADIDGAGNASQST
ncbi:MAG: ankyrin repeat domain-containing protein, partial [Longimicrobiales bacterium]